MYIEEIELRDFCCFEQTKITFTYKGKRSSTTDSFLPNMNLILGENSTGKTALLRGLAMAVLGTVMQSGGMRPYMLVRRSGNSFDQKDPPEGKNASVQAKIQLHNQDAHISGVPKAAWGDTISGSTRGQTVIKRTYTTEEIVSTALINAPKWAPLKNDFSPAFFMVGYGASRRNGAAETYDPNTIERSRSWRYQRIAGSFEDSTTLIPIRLWWSTMRDQRRTSSAIAILNSLAPSGIALSVEERSQGTEVLFSLHGVPLPYQSLSDGFRTLIGFIADLLYHLAQVAPPKVDLTSLHGVVLIDELDLSLHPMWQRTIVGSLAAAFPNLQFFITTHSPILTGGLQYNNIVIAERDIETGAAGLHRNKERVFGLTADQVLGSGYFGLPTSRAPAAEVILRQLAKHSSEGDEQATDDYMRLLAEGFGPEDMARSNVR